MSGQERSLKTAFADAEQKRDHLSTLSSSITDEYQENLAAAIASYQECIQIASAISLFSPNESLEDVNSTDLQYLLLHYHLAELIQKTTRTDRKTNVSQAQQNYERFLKQLDQYDLLSKEDARLQEIYRDNPKQFSVAAGAVDAVARRDAKIKRFKEEKELKNKLEYLRQNPSALSNDDEAMRELQLANIRYAVHMTFQSLEGIALELQMLDFIPPPMPAQYAQNGQSDSRQRQARDDGYSERLDSRVRSLTDKTGPILDRNGKPLRPFTLLDQRQTLRDGVFRPDHSLPTMSIDEYLEEERRRGGMIDGGGPQSEIRPEPDEDDYEKADAETMKARAWDEYKEANPKGSGNTMNMG